MDEKLFGTIIAVTVGIIMCGALLAPIVADAISDQYNKQIYTNIDGDDQIYLSPVTSETSNTLSVTSAGIVADSESIPYWTDTDYENVVLMTDTITVIVSGAGAISVLVSTGVTGTVTSFAAVVSAGEITYSVDEGDSVTTTYAAGYIATKTGDYVSCPVSQTKYFDSDNFAQVRYDSGYYAYIDGTGYFNGEETNMTVESTEVSNTDGQVFTLDSIRYSTTKALTSICVMEANPAHEWTEHPGIVAIFAVIVPLVILCLFTAFMGFMRRD